jgi:hypothetical protein
VVGSLSVLRETDRASGIGVYGVSSSSSSAEETGDAFPRRGGFRSGAAAGQAVVHRDLQAGVVVVE